MNKDLKESLKRYSNVDEEVCGVIAQNTLDEISFIPTKNIHEDPKNYFRIDPNELARIKKSYKILSIFHSHPFHSSLPSDFDKNYSRAQCLPYLIYGRKDDTFYSFHPETMNTSLLERKYIKSIQDEATFLKDFFIKNQMLKKEYQESVNYYDVARDIINSTLKDAGYKEKPTKDLKIYDIIFFSDPNIKIGIFLGDNMFTFQNAFYSGIMALNSALYKKMCKLYSKV